MKLDHDTALKAIDGSETTLEDYRGKVMLIVNTASRCGFTPQYEGLQQLWQKYADDGLVVLGFPCNQFRGQEPGENAEIAEFCRLDFGVDFPMFARIEVNGPGTHPLFAQLKDGARGVLWTKRIKWNFTKFLVGRDGTILARFAPGTPPSRLEPEIERALGL